MKLSGIERRAGGGFNVSTVVVIVVASGMWLATLADRAFHLGWGWDGQILWVAPIIVVGTILVRQVGRGIFRWVGALPPKSQ